MLTLKVSQGIMSFIWVSSKWISANFTGWTPFHASCCQTITGKHYITKF